MITSTMDKTLSAYMALNQIRNKVRGKTALDLFHLKNILKENIDFLNEEEVRLVEEHGGKITESGAILFADKEKRGAYQKARTELGEMETEIKADQVTVNLEQNPEITMQEIEMLDGFVIFE